MYVYQIPVINHQGGESKYKSPVHSSNGQSTRAFQKSMSVDPDSVDADEVKSKKVSSSCYATVLLCCLYTCALSSS